MIDRSYIDEISPKVLIVDDDAEIINIFGSFLGAGFKRQVATSGEGALKILNTSKELPDLILLDLLMPGIDGYEVCRRIKADERLKDIPIIFISALLEVNNIEKAFEIGGVDYIEKPCEARELQTRVLSRISSHRKEMKLQEDNTVLNDLVQEKVKEISESQMATIFALARLTESRDDDTGKHLERVQAFSRLLLEKMSVKRTYGMEIGLEYIEAVEKASVLHDIGKIGIEDHILLKPGKLTEEEFDRMKDHTVIGGRTLSEVYKQYPGNKFVRLGIEIASFHHEKWDGSGYPNGLRGENIPFSARVVALADVYDAVRSKRVYKEKYNHKKVCNMISEIIGQHLDPVIVEVFLENEKEFENIYDSLNS